MSYAMSSCLMAFAASARGQALPPGALQQLDRTIGQRVEATAVLSTQTTVSRSGLAWNLNDADGSIYKIPWKSDLTDPMPTFVNGLDWAPVIEGGVGYSEFKNNFTDNVLAGNESDYQTAALGLGFGPRLFFGKTGFSILPAFDLLYAYTDNDFIARTPAGQQVVADGRFVNWEVHTISFVPSLEVRYKKTFGRWTPAFASTAVYFYTQPLSRSTDALSFRSESTSWVNRVDVDYLTPWCVLDCPMHVSSDLSRTEVYGGLRESLNTSYYYQAQGHLSFDVLGKIWLVKNVGINGGYFWCGAFNGYSLGVEGSVHF